MTKPLKTPKATKGDTVHTAIKTGLTFIPVLGAPAAELFQLVIQPPLEKRRIEWMNDVADHLQKLQDSGVSLDNLVENEAFISATMQASAIALRTHQDEKRTALRNAVLNVAVGQSPNDALQHIFLHWVDVFSPLHLRILKLFQCPPKSEVMLGGALSQVLEKEMPELVGQRSLYDQIWKDLHTNGLVGTDSLHGMMSATGLSQPRTKELGETFIKFISEPIEER